MNRPGFLLVTADDAARIAAALTSSDDPTLRAIAVRLQDGGAKPDPKPRPTGRRASELWDTFMEVRKQVPVSVAAFLAQEKDPFPGTEGETGRGGRASKEQMEDRIDVASFCILAQPNGITSDVRSVLAQRWGVGDPMVSRTIKLAAERLKGQARPDDDLRAKVVAHGWNVYDAALRAKRPQAAVGALDGIARTAGLVRGNVEVNIYERPEFIEATNRIAETLHDALDDGAVALMVPDVNAGTVSRVLDAARSLVSKRIASVAGPPLLETVTD